MEPRNGFKPQFLELVFSHHQAGGGGIVLLAGVARGDHPAFERAQLAQALQGRIGAVAFVVREHDRVALFLRDRHRHQLVVELARRPGRSGALVAACGIHIAGLAADIPVFGEVLGGFDHPGNDPEAFGRLAHHAAAGEPVVERQIARAHTLANVCGIMFDVRHAFAPARHHHVAHPGLDHHRGVDHRLQARAASPVKLVARHFDRQASRKP